MDNFKTIYKILKILEKSMNVEEFDKALDAVYAKGNELKAFTIKEM